MRIGTAWVQRDLVGLVVGFSVIALLAVGFVALGDDTVPPTALLVAPVATAILARAWATALVGTVSAITAFLALSVETIELGGALVRLGLGLGTTLIAVVLAGQRDRREAKLLEGRTLNQLRVLTSALAGAVTPPEVARVVVQHGRLVLGASTGLAYVLEDDSLELLASTSTTPLALEGFERVAIDAPVPVADVARTRTMLVLDRRRIDAEYPVLGRSAAIQSRLLVGVPLAIDADVLGAVFFGFSRTARLLPAERALARAIADQGAQALHRARLYDASVLAEASVRTLQEVTAALAEASSVEDVSDVVLRESVQRIGAQAAAVILIDEDDRNSSVLTAAAGLPDAVVERWGRFPVGGPLPVEECLHTDDVVVLESRTEIEERYPVLATETAEGGTQSGIWVPIPSLRGTTGTLCYFFAAERRFDKSARELFASLAAQCGQALERARLMTSEQERHERLRAAALRTEQLDRLMAAFSHALTREELAEAFVTTGVPALGARFGALYRSEPGHRRLVLLPTARSRDEAGVVDLVDLDGPSVLAHAARSSTPVFLADRDELLAEFPSFDGGPLGEHDQAWAALPLTAYGVMVGVLGLWYDAPQQFDTEERAHLVLVGQRCGAAKERARLYEAERGSRQEAQRSAESLAELQALTAALTRSARSTEVAETVLAAAVPALDAVAGFVVVQRPDGLAVVGARNLPALGERWRLEQSEPVAEVLRSSRSRMVERLADLDDEEGRAFLAELGVRSVAFVALRGRDRVVGVLGMGWPDVGSPAGKSASVLATMAAVGGQALERAALFDAEHAIADTLQRSLLPALPARLGRIELQGRYRPGTSGTQVGGDWYDAIALADERVCLVVGDVEGRGVRAASTMGQVRAALRALTRTSSDPATLLEALNDGLIASASPMVTMAIAIVDPEGHVSFGYAGHPPIFARRPDGTVEELMGGRSVPLGVVDHATFRTAEVQLEKGTSLVLYTDGLVERRQASIDEGLQRMAASIEPEAASLPVLADRLLGLAEAEHSDDVAVLVARVATGEERLVFQGLRRLGEVRAMRSTLANWLQDHGATDEEVLGLTLAVSEAAVNALQHAYPLTGGTVDIAAEVAGDDLIRATVVDHGRWRDPEATTDGKRGLRLMRGVAEVDLATDDHGTVVTIRRRLGAPA